MSRLSDVASRMGGPSGAVEEVGRGGAGVRNAGSSISPLKRGTGNVSGVERKSSWPAFQSSAVKKFVRHRAALSGFLSPSLKSTAIAPSTGHPSKIDLRMSFPTGRQRQRTVKSKKVVRITYSNNPYPRIWPLLAVYPAPGIEDMLEGAPF